MGIGGVSHIWTGGGGRGEGAQGRDLPGRSTEETALVKNLEIGPETQATFQTASSSRR